MSKPAPRPINDPAPGLFKMKLVKGGPWVGAAITKRGGKWQAIVDGVVTGESMNCDPSLNPAIMKIWHWGRDVTPDEYQNLVRPDRSVQAREPINLVGKAPPF
jgi:hypothetical protein